MQITKDTESTDLKQLPSRAGRADAALLLLSVHERYEVEPLCIPPTPGPEPDWSMPRFCIADSKDASTSMLETHLIVRGWSGA